MYFVDLAVCGGNFGTFSFSKILKVKNLIK